MGTKRYPKRAGAGGYRHPLDVLVAIKDDGDLSTADKLLLMVAALAMDNTSGPALLQLQSRSSFCTSR